MMEFIFVLPVLLIVLMLLLFFGRGMLRVQHAQVMTHYEAWRRSTPVRDAADNSSVLPAPTSGDEHRLMNGTFFGDHAQTLAFGDSGEFPDDANRVLSQAAAFYDPDAGDLADLNTRGDVGFRATSRVTHEETRPLWQRFNGAIANRHVIFGSDWAYVRGWRVDRNSDDDGNDDRWRYDSWSGGSPSVMTSVRDRYLLMLDQRLEAAPAVGSGANPLAASIRSLYLGHPGYQGPEVTPD